MAEAGFWPASVATFVTDGIGPDFAVASPGLVVHATGVEGLAAAIEGAGAEDTGLGAISVAGKAVFATSAGRGADSAGPELVGVFCIGVASFCNTAVFVPAAVIVGVVLVAGRAVAAVV